MKLKKGRAFGVWAILLVLTVVSANQTWFTLEMQPQDTTVVIQSFSGTSTYSFLTPTLLLIASQSVFFFLVEAKTRIWTGIGSAITTIMLAIVLALAVLSRDVSSLAAAVESATGIAAQHGLEGVTVAAEISGYLTVLALLALSVFQVMTTIGSKSWPKRVARTQRAVTSNAEPEDTISLWDSQR